MNELIEALEPFALEAAQWHPHHKDHLEVFVSTNQGDAGWANITVGDLRRLARIHAELVRQQRSAA
ncbi:hypothetical protein [Stutzerimonas stutzeri]|uniref:hypothetical protein n=1 Tax=Stutzerimonas stutzeri TaxID=316 RepID=UPI0037150F39